jgi:hypothetical protein
VLTFGRNTQFAPNRPSRLALALATLAETVVVVYVALAWFQPFQQG